MARKKFSRILSGGVIVACTVLLCTLNVSAQMTAEEVTFNISGSVGVPGVTMRGLVGPGGQTVITDAGGYYNVAVKWNFSGTVTPILDGWTFDPPSNSYSNLEGNQENQNYTATPVMYTISGTTSPAMEGVRMTGLPGEPVTGSDGSYSATVQYGWSSVVTPMMEGYEFIPPSKTYDAVKRDMPRENYNVKRQTFTISGTTEVEGVVLEGFPTNVVSGSNGNYSTEVDWDWSGTITPKKEGYTFMPDSVPYPNVTFDQSGQNYIAEPITFTISGTTGLANVEMKGFPNPVFTNQNGYYEATVNWGWSGTVTPQTDGFTFKPASQSYSNVVDNKDNQIYEATMRRYIISGSTRIEGVEMYGLPGSPLTGPDGSYSVTVDWNWSGTVIPTKDGHDFNPPEKQYPPVNSDLTNQNYTGQLKNFTISGTTTVPSVTLQGAPGRTMLSGSDGSYSFSVPWDWTGTITPRKEGYEFTPTNLQYANIRNDEFNQTYSATPLKYKISGAIRSDQGQMVEGVLMTSDLGLTATTDALGQYTLEVNYGWGGMVTPTREGYTFRPRTLQYTKIVRNMLNQNYNATPQMFTITSAIVMGGTPIPGVKITATDIPRSTQTNAQGEFSIQVPYGWTGEVVPDKPGFRFIPASESYTNVTTNYKMGQPEAVTPPPTGLPREVPPPTGLPREVPPPTGLPREVPPPTGLPREVPPPTGLPEDIPDANQAAVDPELRKIQQQLADLLAKQARPQVGAPGTQEYDPGKIPVSDTYAGEDLLLVFENLGTQAGIPIIAEETVFGTAYCTLDKVPLDLALEIVLASTPYVYKKTPYYYLVSPGDPNSPLFSAISETRPVKLDYVKAESAIAMLSDAFLPYVKADPDPNGHTLLVTGPTNMVNRIIADLEKVDQTPTHVMLDARIVVMERGDLLNLGIEWGWPRIRTGVFANELHGNGTEDSFDFGGKWPWGIQIGYSPDATFTSSLEMALNLLVVNEEAKIVSTPQVVALDGKQAKIQVLREEYQVLTSPQLTSFGFSTNYLQDITSGTTLTITPYIGDDNEITLEMAVEVSDSAPHPDTGFPVVTRRTAQNTVRVNDGGTAIVAGLTENRSARTDRRVPGLSNLPLIGPLFKNKGDQSSTREIAVFVIAHIMPEDGMGVEYTGPSATSLMQQQPQQPQMPQPQFPQIPAEPPRNDFQSSLLESISRRPR